MQCAVKLSSNKFLFSYASGKILIRVEFYMRTVISRQHFIIGPVALQLQFNSQLRVYDLERDNESVEIGQSL